MLAATNLVGTAVLRYVMQVPPLASLSIDEVVLWLRPRSPRYLTAPAKVRTAGSIAREFPCTATADRSRPGSPRPARRCVSIQSLSRDSGGFQAVSEHDVGEHRMATDDAATTTK